MRFRHTYRTTLSIKGDDPQDVMLMSYNSQKGISAADLGEYDRRCDLGVLIVRR